VLWKVFRRSVILFALGLFINNGFDVANWRIPGVLQRFAIAYFMVSMIIIFVPKIQMKNDESVFRDIFPFVLQWMVAILLLIIYLLVTYLLDVPNCGRGYIGPGGIGDYGKYPNCTGGAAGYIDLKIFGNAHMYQSPTCKDLYKTGGYDPEGTLGNLTSIFLCFLGLQAGRILISYKSSLDRIIRWISWGIVWGALGTLLCNAEKNGGWIPINKNLWSPSFIFVMAGTGFCSLALCYFIVDVRNWWNGSPFQYVGMNSILIYCLHETLSGYFPFHYQIPQTHEAKLIENLIGISVWMIIAYRMYQLEFFVNI